jgi:hypothetical protein
MSGPATSAERVIGQGGGCLGVIALMYVGAVTARRITCLQISRGLAEQIHWLGHSLACRFTKFPVSVVCAWPRSDDTARPMSLGGRAPQNVCARSSLR